MHRSDAGSSELVERLRDATVGVRSELDVSRHLFRGRVSYVIQDPLTFQSHRLGLADYRVFVRIRAERSLGEIFRELTEEGILGERDEESFYHFVVSLHRLGFLHLPVTDVAGLLRRHHDARRSRRAQLAMSFLFLRVPLINPDDFLNRTVRHVKFLYTRWAFAVWAGVVGSAIGVAISRHDALLEPLNGAFTTGNLFLLWSTLIVLKVFHEFGHAYACKVFGGHVPEMGVFLIAFTPCAYVDASTSWGFPSKLQRLIVCMGGIYVELFIASLALFYWCLAEPSLLRSIAYNVFVLAGVTTVAFNVNPLMRFDGYYALADLLEVPNLRSRSQQHVIDVLKSRLFGLDVRGEEGRAGFRCFLFFFGVCASLYRICVTLAIAGLVATKFLIVGVGLAAGVLLTEVTRAVARVLRWLWMSEETRSRPLRRVLATATLTVALPVGLICVPFPGFEVVGGVVRFENEASVFAEVAGRVEDVRCVVGDRLRAGEELVRLENVTLRSRRIDADARLESARIRHRARSVEDPSLARQEERKVELYESEASARREEAERLVVKAPQGGTLVRTVSRDELGRFVEPGEELALLGSGSWVVRACLSERQIAEGRVHVGQQVSFRSTADPRQTLEAIVAWIAPSRTRSIEYEALTHVGGGDIAVNPQTREATRPYYDVMLRLTPDSDVDIAHGLTGRVCFGGSYDPLGVLLLRKFLRFYHRLN